ncbi:uncharacterized protein THITE_161622, partial [Thermothielavioides terrestris NRRL 8126]
MTSSRPASPSQSTHPRAPSSTSSSSSSSSLVRVRRAPGRTACTPTTTQPDTWAPAPNPESLGLVV